MGIEIKLNDYAFAEAVDQGIQLAIRERMEKVDGEIREQISDLIAERIRSLTKDALRVEFDRVLAEGWTKTDSYGRPTGGKVTLSGQVLEHITKGDGYREPLATIHREAVEAALKGEMGKLIVAATEKLRGMLDATIAEKLRAVLKDAVK